MANMDQSYLIELDTNVSPTILIKQLIERLNNFHVHKACKVLRLSDAKDIPEEEVAASLSDSIETEEMIQNLIIQKRLSPKFKWRRSKWLRYCPVSLKNGALVEGRSEFAAAYVSTTNMPGVIFFGLKT
jgi:adenylate/nucleoside-diphosphate kinase